MKELKGWSKSRGKADLIPLFEKLTAKPDQIFQLTKGERVRTTSALTTASPPPPMSTPGCAG